MSKFTSAPPTGNATGTPKTRAIVRCARMLRSIPVRCPPPNCPRALCKSPSGPPSMPSWISRSTTSTYWPIRWPPGLPRPPVATPCCNCRHASGGPPWTRRANGGCAAARNCSSPPCWTAARPRSSMKKSWPRLATAPTKLPSAVWPGCCLWSGCAKNPPGTPSAPMPC